jgi:hypothetical protein
VSAEVLGALQPFGVEAALSAWDHRQESEDQKQRALELALDKCRYEANRAQRQYDATDPSNRLVAAELERRWNEALQKVAGLETRLEMMQQSAKVLVEEDRLELMKLGEDLDLVWNHPHCQVLLKKRILRTIIREIIVTEDVHPATILMTVHWHGGVHTHLEATRRTQGQHDNGNDLAVIDVVRELAAVCNDAAVVSILNRLGYRTGAGNTWTESRVQHLRHTHQIPACPPAEGRPWITMTQAAEQLKVSSMVVRRLIAQKILPARQVVKYAPWVIERKDLDLAVVRKAIWLVHEGLRDTTVPADQASLFVDV